MGRRDSLCARHMQLYWSCATIAITVDLIESSSGAPPLYTVQTTTCGDHRQPGLHQKEESRCGALREGERPMASVNGMDDASSIAMGRVCHQHRPSTGATQRVFGPQGSLVLAAIDPCTVAQMVTWRVETGPPGDVRGRRLIAAISLQPGNLVLQEHAYAAVLYDDVLARLCDCCFQPGNGSLLRCSGCKQAYYVDREHQARAWRLGHKEECAALRQLAPRMPPPTVRLAARALLRNYREASQASQGFGTERSTAGLGSAPSRGSTPAAGADSTTGDRYEAVLSLVHHWESVPDQLKIQYAQMGALAWQLVDLACPAAAKKAIPKDVALLVARFACNNHTICDEELRPLGVGLYPLVSMANHSCSPNCMQSFQGSTLVLRAITHVAPGEELTIAYVELGATRWERRASLRAQYYFDIDGPEAQSLVVPGSENGSNKPQPTATVGCEGAAASEVPDSPSRQGQHSSLLLAATGGNGPSPTSGPSYQEPTPIRVVTLAGVAAELRLYSCKTPPWPHDERDVELTAVQWRGDSQPHRLPVGGMWGELLPASELVTSASAVNPTSAADAALESFPVDMDGLAPKEQPAAELPSSDAWGPSSGQDGRQGGKQVQVIVHFWSPDLQHDPVSQHGMDDSLASLDIPGLQQRQQQQQQQQQQLDQQQRQQLEDHADAGLLQAAAVLAVAYAQALLCLAEAESLLCPAAPAAAGVAEAAARSGAAGTATAAARASGLAEQSLATVSPSGAGPGGEGLNSLLSQRSAETQENPAPRHGLAFGLGPRHVLRMRLLSTAVRAAIAAGDRWEKAADWARQLLPVYQFVYPEVWPNLGFHYATLAKLEHLLGGRPQQAQHAAQRALAILTKTHGGASGGAGGVVEEVKRVLFESGQELAQHGG